jgi:hypothetical protein
MQVYERILYLIRRSRQQVIVEQIFQSYAIVTLFGMGETQKPNKAKAGGLIKYSCIAVPFEIEKSKNRISTKKRGNTKRLSGHRPYQC